jgi:hypothetical protein
MRLWAEPALARPEQAVARELAGRALELAELRPEQAGTPKQLIARIVKQNLPPAPGAWSGTPKIKDAWQSTAGCGLVPELTEYALALGKGAVRRKARVAWPPLGP